jgi:hypothetical protein
MARVALPVLVAVAAISPGWPENPSGRAHAAPTRAAKAKPTKPAKQGFAYTVSDCLGPENVDSVAMEQTEGSIKFKQILTMNCIAATHPNTVKVTFAKKGSNLEVTVILDSDLKSDCTCPIEIDGRISNLAKGNYRLSFVHESRLGPSEDEKATKKVLGTQEFSVGP